MIQQRDLQNIAWLKCLHIHGYRGFAQPETVHFSVPDGRYGSGTTIIVGPNNAGKSTIIESVHAVVRPAPSFSEGKRNKLADDRVSIRAENSNNESKELATVSTGGSETTWTNEKTEPARGRIFVLPSRRTFDPHFGKGSTDRNSYMNSYELPALRRSALQFSRRLFRIQDRREEFDSILSRILRPVPEWYIEQNETGQYYLKVRSGKTFHNSDGMGDGLVSLMVRLQRFAMSLSGSGGSWPVAT